MNAGGFTKNKTRNFKICLVIPSLTMGGAQRVMSLLAEEFACQNNIVHLILLTDAPDFYKLSQDIIIHRLGFRNNGRIQKIVSEIITFWELRNLLRQEKPDIVLSFMDKYNVLTVLASCFLRLKVFISDRSNPKKKIPLHIAFLKRITYRYATGIITQTSLAKEILEKKTNNRNIRVIPNPVRPVQLFPCVRREKIILNIGRLIPEKGQAFLLEAFKKLDAPDWKLVILGDGPLWEQLLNKAKELQIENQLFMPGAVTNVDEWMARASIFAFPSLSEGFPNALTEAMAAGLPCVSFSCDAGPGDLIIDNVNGMLVKTYDVQGLSERLKQLKDNQELCNSLSAESVKIRSEIDISKIARKYLTIFMAN